MMKNPKIDLNTTKASIYIRFGTEAQAQEFKGGVNIVKKTKR